MESYIPISMINDYLFCPRSIYLHGVYSSFDTSAYHDVPQKRGKIAHETIDEGHYSTSKHVLQGTRVYSDDLCVMGRIDVFFQDTGLLVERKYLLKNVYLGNRYQLYAQMCCLEYMGYSVSALAIHSLSDNRRYPVDIPDSSERSRFLETIGAMRSVTADIPPRIDNDNKCQQCIYRPLCH